MNSHQAEFVEAFGKRTGDEPFVAKVPVTEADNTEFIWIDSYRDESVIR